MFRKWSLFTCFAALVLTIPYHDSVAQDPLGELRRLAPSDGPHMPWEGQFAGGLWKTAYDSHLDGELNIRESAVIEFASANHCLIGNYHEHRAVGKDNHSLFTGQLIPGTVPVVMLKQEDRGGYTALYTGRLVSKNRFVGSYLDNQGMGGDWSLELVSETETTDPSQPLETIEEGPVLIRRPNHFSFGG